MARAEVRQSALNQGGAPNGAAAPAAAGLVIAFYATGEGQTQPAGVDGKPAAAAVPDAVALVRVTIGGVPAEVRYAGGAPARSRESCR